RWCTGLVSITSAPRAMASASSAAVGRGGRAARTAARTSSIERRSPTRPCCQLAALPTWWPSTTTRSVGSGRNLAELSDLVGRRRVDDDGRTEVEELVGEDEVDLKAGGRLGAGRGRAGDGGRHPDVLEGGAHPPHP